MINRLPRWRGFNLLEMFIYRPEQVPETVGDPEDFREADFAFTRDWGFDFLRIPMDYRYWFDPVHPETPREAALARMDRLLALAEAYQIHLCLNFHRAPGYCINPPAEPTNLWQDPRPQALFGAHWQALARRYVGVPSARLSFDLVNEPPAVSPAMTRADHARVITAATAAIRAVDPQRLIIADGLSGGHEPSPELIGLGIAQSCRAYAPFGISHYQAPWLRPYHDKPPRWPGADHFGYSFGPRDLEVYYAPWKALLDAGVGVHCGEGGCFNKTPHPVFLAWFEDVLKLLRRLNIGWALWNLRGNFGVLDSGRTDVAYQAFHGHQLDAALLTLLQRY